MSLADSIKDKIPFKIKEKTSFLGVIIFFVLFSILNGFLSRIGELIIENLAPLISPIAPKIWEFTIFWLFTPTAINLNLFSVMVVTVIFFQVGYLIDTLLFKKNKKEILFEDNFKQGLIRWEYESGKITIENTNELSITRSSTGVLTKNGQNWRNYVFRFETKIANKCSAWIVRARDFNNYVMFQFNKSGIRLHYRIQGMWDVAKEEKPVRVKITDNEWFNVKIEINGDRAIIFIKDTEVYNEEVFSSNPEDPKIKFISFPVGRIGFREWGQEHAYFRNIRVNVIL